jgi:hypothetical protein
LDLHEVHKADGTLGLSFGKERYSSQEAHR